MKKAQKSLALGNTDASVASNLNFHSFTNYCVKVLLELYESENENFLMSLKHCALEDMTMYDAVASLLVVRGVVIKDFMIFSTACLKLVEEWEI